MFARWILVATLITSGARAHAASDDVAPPSAEVPQTREQETAAKIITYATRKGSAPALPRLGSRDIDPDKLAPWKKWLRDLWESFRRRFLPDAKAGPGMIETLKILGYLLMVALVALLCFALYRWLRRQTLPRTRSIAPRKRAHDARDVLLQRLREALERRDFAAAARIRWRLLQSRLGRPSGETPHELVRRGHLRPEEDFGLKVDESQRLMFAPMSNDAAETSRKWQQGLAQLESQGLPQTTAPDSPRLSEKGAIGEAALLLLIAAGMIGILVFGLIRESTATRELSVARGEGAYQIRGILSQRNSEDVHLLNLPYLETATLGPTDESGANVILMISPRMSLSGRESRVLRERLEAGAHVILSFHDETSRKAVFETLARLMPSISDEAVADESFHDQKTAIAVAPVEMTYFRKGESYEFYSPYRMQDMKCEFEEFFCYAREYEIQNGAITLIAGVFPGSAALVTRRDNPLFASRLALDPRPLAIDQYHLLQSDRGYLDLATEAFFGIPMFILLAGLLVYLIWGAESAARRGYSILRADRPGYLKRRPFVAESYHAFSRRLLRQSLQKPGAAADARELQSAWLAQLMTARSGRVTPPPTGGAAELTGTYAAWLKQNFLWKTSGKEIRHDDTASL